MLKMNEIINWDEKALIGKIESLKNEVFTIRMQKVTSGIEKPHKIKENKRDIARLYTILNRKSEK
ncbi:MAG: 50S ribosomal protein L29 [Bdellovibrionales bacterium RIFOXYB1_FULL_37_110]|nr:MAG: 50S ribosomal protein L29 [Bdellovibrionales bacterium RIFOXYA1_FULL_38_20]OFZ47237.1 MAG: 50S ribosomal protein L29 [Bdellovibrionales bacterium RIFOXYC1_FULL_37_79]OFZ58460.1 MAG: 50S ribosomal protein L29 [Bdellovibrionales bacterium RIFOXYB1_FULL_37_110]OFZ61706.1 MAG: 50S ribosomal protein L29 [Bdellovibrionales bacterium RIFOXYB2_FULL_36_6]OFZ63531.1 MAG: 50S ribosomal protein L29 [Bdellovibrionales bacterium RIFOXYD1_FULL_36_51]